MTKKNFKTSTRVISNVKKTKVAVDLSGLDPKSRRAIEKALKNG